MRRTGRHTFDAPIDQVWRMFRDPASHLAKAERAGHRDLEIVAEEITDEHVHVEIARTVTLELPGFAKKVLSPTNRITTVDDWHDHGDGTYGGTFTSDFRGAPVELLGTTHLEADGDARTAYRLDIDVKVRIPVLGRKLESWAEKDIDEQIANEFAAGDEWLADHG